MSFFFWNRVTQWVKQFKENFECIHCLRYNLSHFLSLALNGESTYTECGRSLNFSWQRSKHWIWHILLRCPKFLWRLFNSNTRGGSRGRVQGVRTPTPPPGMTCCRFLINTVQSLDRHTKSALSFDMYSQQFTLCYFPVKSPLLRIRF